MANKLIKKDVLDFLVSKVNLEEFGKINLKYFSPGSIIELSGMFRLLQIEFESIPKEMHQKMFVKSEYTNMFNLSALCVERTAKTDRCSRNDTKMIIIGICILAEIIMKAYDMDVEEGSELSKKVIKFHSPEFNEMIIMNMGFLATQLISLGLHYLNLK